MPLAGAGDKSPLLTGACALVPFGLARVHWRRAADRVTRRPDDALLDLGQAGKGGAHHFGLSLTSGKVCAGFFDHFGRS